jgi:hypothetical protein
MSEQPKKNKIFCGVRKKRKTMRIQGIEPWSVPWEGTMIPLHQMRFDDGSTLINYLFTSMISRPQLVFCFAHCDDLVLSADDAKLYLFNAATRDAVAPPKQRRPAGCYHSAAGLGLDPRTKGGPVP